MSDITFEVKKTITVLSSTQKGWKKEANLISWNNGPVKLDIREWSPDKSSMKKGITLNRSEALELKHYLEILDFGLLGEPAKRQYTRPEREEKSIPVPQQELACAEQQQTPPQTPNMQPNIQQSEELPETQKEEGSETCLERAVISLCEEAV